MVNLVLSYALGALGLLFVALAYFTRQRRFSWLTAGICSLSAAVAAHYQVFWVLATFGLGAVWAVFCALPVMDFGWRLKTGFVAALGMGALLCVWPTVSTMSSGKLPCPDYVKDNVPFRIVAGLDLRGGLRLVYTVDVEEAIKDKRDRYFDEMREQLATAFGFHQGDKPPTRDELAHLGDKVRLEKPRDKPSIINITFVDPNDDAKVDDAFLKRFSGEMAVQRPQKGAVGFKIRPEVESRFREGAVNQAKETINRRIDELGLREAAVTVRDEDIVIEVPGEDESTFKEIRDIISQTARLEFKLLDDSNDFLGQVAKNVKEEDLPKGVTIHNNIENAPVGPGKTNPIHYAVIRKQPDETMKEARARLAEWISTQSVPDDHEMGYEALTETDPATLKSNDIGFRTYYLFNKAEITGDMLRDAQAVPDQSNRGLGGWYVALTFTEAGGDRFEEVTGANVKRRFAIILDGSIYSAPVIQTRIAGGHASITLGSSENESQLEEARKLELVLRSGALPAPISPSNEQRIGPSLGKDAIAQGVKGALAGSLLVLVFMVLYYHRAGAVADIAVLFNLLLQLAVLASFGASMTLPGIAGLALTIGMAVDANVLINERIREELRNGKSPRAAVDAGYEKAFSAILDGHVTTFISGLILAQYGTGPIKGFAVTLIVGILASLFTGVVCTRLVFDWWVRGRKIKTLNIG
jgi:preprotein translocase subunit SecD